MAECQRRQVPSMRRVNKSEYVTPSTTLTYDLPVFLALPCPQLPDVVRLWNYMEKTTWKRYINSQRDVVIPTTSAYADLDWNGLADVPSLTRGLRLARPCGWI